MHYELWDAESRNLIESFDTAPELRAALREMDDLTGIGLAVRDEYGKAAWYDPGWFY